MKKQIAAAMALLMLTGCSTDKVATAGSVTMTGDQLMKKLDTPEKEYQFLLEKLYDKKYPTTDSMQKQADERAETTKKQFRTNYGKSWQTTLNTYLSQAGFSSMNDYKKQYISYLKRQQFIKAYVKDNFDKAFDEYTKYGKPLEAYMITIAAKDTSKPTAAEKKKLSEAENYIKKNGFLKGAQKYGTPMYENKKGYMGVIDKITASYLDSYANGLTDATFKLKTGQHTKFMKGTGYYVMTYAAESSRDKIKAEMKKLPSNSPLYSYKTSLEAEAFKASGITYKKNAKKMNAYVNSLISQGNNTLRNGGVSGAQS